jgi:cytochrome b subunit of formate dehydrogenase
MTVHERAAHLCMMLCFITLTYTGFAVLYPGAWWTAPLGWLSSTDDLRRWLHRGAGLVLTGLVFHHLYFIFGTRRGREQRREFWPRLRDFRHLWLNLLFYFGRRETRPQFTRFTYMEKAEYWALVWGTGLMVVTGFVVWFDEQAMRLIPRSAWEVFLIVHRYEAILALLTIMVWHFYYIFANPDESPMALTWLTGRISLEAVERIHPEEFARIDLLMNEHPEDLARLHAGAERSKAASRDE